MFIKYLSLEDILHGSHHDITAEDDVGDDQEAQFNRQRYLGKDRQDDTKHINSRAGRQSNNHLSGIAVVIVIIAIIIISGFLHVSSFCHIFRNRDIRLMAVYNGGDRFHE